VRKKAHRLGKKYPQNNVVSVAGCAQFHFGLQRIALKIFNFPPFKIDIPPKTILKFSRQNGESFSSV